MAATATMATSGSARKRLLKEEDMTKVEFETSEEVDVTPTFDTMGLREDLLRGIYAYGPGPRGAGGEGGEGGGAARRESRGRRRATPAGTQRPPRVAVVRRVVLGAQLGAGPGEGCEVFGRRRVTPAAGTGL